MLPPIFRGFRVLKGERPIAAQARRFSLPGQESFAGYYDIQPGSPDGEALLAHCTRVSRRAKRAGDEASLGFFERDDGAFVEIARSTLWCWQLGARLRWWPGERRALAFNAVAGGVPSYCVAVDGRAAERLVDRPLFDVSDDGRLGVALNFGRLAKARPGYGYPDIEDPFAGEQLPEGDGVSIVDIGSGRADLVAPLGEIARLDGQAANAFHYLNAASLSPEGTAFSVLHKHLASLQQTSGWKVTAVVGRSDGSRLRSVSLPGAASHYWWLDEDRIVFTSNAGGASKSSYLLYDFRDESVTAFDREAPPMDGHPSYHRASDRWITDQYPDFFGEQALHLLEPDCTRREIARFHADPAYKDEWKCDLHPRWLPEGQSVAVDSTHEGFRAIYEVAVPEQP